MLSTWIAVWVIGSYGMALPAALVGWNVLALGRISLAVMLLGIVLWGGAMACALQEFEQRKASSRMSSAVYRRLLPLIALTGVWLAVLAFLYPGMANGLLLFVLLAGGCPAFLSLLFFLREIECCSTVEGRPEIARA